MRQSKKNYINVSSSINACSIFGHINSGGNAKNNVSL